MEHNKDFKIWQKVKAFVHNEKPRVFFHEREIWGAFLGENVGFEQDGKGKDFLRPALILKKFNNEVCWILPLTKTQKTGKYYFSVQIPGRETKRAVILSQIKLVDVKRLKYKMGDLPESDFVEIKTKIKQFLA